MFTVNNKFFTFQFVKWLWDETWTLRYLSAHKNKISYSVKSLIRKYQRKEKRIDCTVAFISLITDLLCLVSSYRASKSVIHDNLLDIKTRFLSALIVRYIIKCFSFLSCVLPATIVFLIYNNLHMSMYFEWWITVSMY